VAMEGLVWPIKTRELRTQLFDSTVWNDFAFRDDDIVISTWSKSGTTWVQQIVSQLLFHGAEGMEVAEMSPWLDLRIPPKEVKLAALEAQSHRRFIKTHLPVDALVSIASTVCPANVCISVTVAGRKMSPPPTCDKGR
jgi:aryl sulfotransferase